jgi:hypothetical protein
MKKLVNEPADVVAEALLGIEAAHPDLRVDHPNKIIYRGDAPVAGKVGLISGGGSGHEPLHGGFVGPGMLDAACAGEVFTSPVPDQMLEATKQVDGGAGVLHIVKNYTGDVMNFEMAAELAAAETGWRRSPVRRPSRAAHSRRWPASPKSSTPTVAAWEWHSLHALSRPWASRPSSSVRTRWRSVSASTENPVADASRWRQPARSPTCWSNRSCPTFPLPAATP